MSSTNTQITDIIVPAIWLPYTLQLSTTLSMLVSSGIMVPDPQFNTLAGAGGQTTNMPFWNDLSGTSQVLSDSGSITTNNITTGQDAAVICNRANAWKHNDLAGILATGNAGDPAAQVSKLVAGFWTRDQQTMLLSILKGIFGSTLSALVHDISHQSGGLGANTAATRFTGSTFIDAKQLLGDAKEMLTAIIIHSQTEAWLSKNNLIDFIPDSESQGMVKVFQGLRVIVDDGMPVATVDSDLAYTSYIFGRGAIAFGMDSANPTVDGGAPGSTWQVEFFREALASNSGMINRRRFILHPRGVKWTGNSMAGSSPTNAELETAANWTRVYDVKHMRVVKFVHNLG